MNRYFTLETESKELFFKIPDVFTLEGSKYITLSPVAKLLYGVLWKRNSLSIMNKWIDEEGRVYFYFKQDEIGKALNVKDAKTIRKYLKELEQYGLLERVNQGLQLPDRLYLKHVEVTADEYFQLIGNYSPSRQGNIPYPDGENIPSNKIENNKINKKEKEEAEENNKKEEVGNKSEWSSTNKEGMKKTSQGTEFDIVINSYTNNEDLKETLYEFIKMRKTIKKPMTTRALKILLNKLDKMFSDEADKIESLNNSILNSWQGVFELKKVNNTNKNKKSFDEYID